jgi:uncharacterized RDD family membrane protein YckC
MRHKLDENPAEPLAAAAGAAAEDAFAQAAPSSEPEWRLEVSRRLDAYRVRHGRQATAEAQARLPFPPATSANAPATPPPRPRPSERRNRERLEIFVDQPGLNFPSDATPSPNHAMVPVARLGRRTLAGLVDIGVLVACWGMFLGMLAALGVQLTEKKLDLAISGTTLFLLYGLYFCLFTAFGGTTPGMRVAGLRTVGFDGNAPVPKQLLWRSFGYLVAGSTVFLGFLWALWDEDRLSWQDRVSQTYLTAMAPVAEAGTAQAEQ